MQKEKDLFAREWKMAAKIKHLNLHFVTPTQLCQITKEIFNDNSKLLTFSVYFIYPHWFYNFMKNSQISQYIEHSIIIIR
jgi:hypothetical protein